MKAGETSVEIELRNDELASLTVQQIIGRIRLLGEVSRGTMTLSAVSVGDTKNILQPTRGS